jgi:poly(A) polymerase
MLDPAKLPPNDWARRQDLVELVAALGDGNARFVGGAVRDTLLGLAAHDIDIATPLEPVEVIARLDAAGIRSVPTGIKHGTVTAIRDADNVEITTLRRDVATDGRHAEVAFSDDWREDAARRDFTINALYADPRTLEVYDYFGGLDDLRGRRVRFIGDPRQRIREDHLRILRYFRFQARFGSNPADEEAEAACRELAPTLKGLSRERIGWEVQNLLALPDPAPTVARMAELGVLRVILPEADPQGLGGLIAAEAREGIAADPIRRLAALLPPAPPVADQVASRLRLSIAQKKRLMLAAERGLEPTPPRALAYRIGRDAAIDRLLLEGESTTALRGWQAPAFPLKGGAIVARGVDAGPQVARILRAVEADWVAENFPDEARLAELLDRHLVG